MIDKLVAVLKSNWVVHSTNQLTLLTYFLWAIKAQLRSVIGKWMTASNYLYLHAESCSDNRVPKLLAHLSCNVYNQNRSRSYIELFKGIASPRCNNSAIINSGPWRDTLKYCAQIQRRRVFSRNEMCGLLWHGFNFSLVTFSGIFMIKVFVYVKEKNLTNFSLMSSEQLRYIDLNFYGNNNKAMYVSF